MIISVKLFAAAKQFAGTDSVAIDVNKSVTVDELRNLLSQQHPELTALLPSARIAVNTEYLRFMAVAQPFQAMQPPASRRVWHGLDIEYKNVH